MPLHVKNQLSVLSHQSGHMENIYDSKTNDHRHQVNKTLNTKNNVLLNYNTNFGPEEEQKYMYGRPPIGNLKNQMTRQLKHPAIDAGYSASNLTMGTINDSQINDAIRVIKPAPKR